MIGWYFKTRELLWSLDLLCLRFLFSGFGNLFFLIYRLVVPVSPTCFLLMLN